MPRTIEEWYLPTDGDDIAPAWDRMMAGGDGLDPIRTDDGGLGGVVLFGSKTYRTTRALEVTRQVVVRGEGQINTRILCVSSSGFHVRFRDDSTNPRVGFGGQESVISDLRLQYSGPRGSALQGGPHHGINVNARAHVERVHVADFPGNGIHILGDVTVQPKTGANLCRLVACRATGCDGAGYYMRGGDANANTFDTCDATDCLAGGFWDDSFLGNFFIACHANIVSRPRDWWQPSDIVGFAGYRPASDNLNASLFTNGIWYPNSLRAVRSSQRGFVLMYTEGANMIDIRPPNFVAPVMGGGVTPASAAAGITMSTSGVVMPTGNATKASDGTEMRLAPYAGESFEVRSPLDSQTVSLKRIAQGPAAGWLGFVRAHSLDMALGVRCDAKTGAPLEAWAPRGMQLGQSVNRRSLNVSPTIPDPTAGSVGDVVLATTPTDTLDGWRKCNGPNGAYWRPFAWGAGT